MTTPSLSSQYPALVSVIALDDIGLADHVRKKLPQGTYTSIAALTQDYAFTAQSSTTPSQKIEARIIDLNVTKKEKAGAFFKAFFAGLGLFDDTSFDGKLDERSLQDQLLTRICGDAAVASEIEKAYDRCTRILLSIAKDLSDIEMQLRESSSIIASYKVGVGTHAVGSLAMRVAVIAASFAV